MSLGEALDLLPSENGPDGAAEAGVLVHGLEDDGPQGPKRIPKER